MLTTLLYILIMLGSLFLICLVLIQRGRGGGLAGAFGAAGGSSAFGTRAGDVFTRITIVGAAIWIALNMILVILSNNSRSGPSTFAPDSKGTDSSLGALPLPDADSTLPPPLDAPSVTPPADPAAPPAADPGTPPATDSTPKPDATP